MALDPNSVRAGNLTHRHENCKHPPTEQPCAQVLVRVRFCD